jgi:hypothetical protein
MTRLTPWRWDEQGRIMMVLSCNGTPLGTRLVRIVRHSQIQVAEAFHDCTLRTPTLDTHVGQSMDEWRDVPGELFIQSISAPT